MEHKQEQEGSGGCFNLEHRSQSGCFNLEHSDQTGGQWLMYLSGTQQSIRSTLVDALF